MTHADNDPYGDPLRRCEDAARHHPLSYLGNYAPNTEPHAKTIFYAPTADAHRFRFTGAGSAENSRDVARPPLAFPQNGNPRRHHVRPTSSGSGHRQDRGGPSSGRSTSSIAGSRLADLSGDGKVAVLGVGKNRTEGKGPDEVLVWTCGNRNHPVPPAAERARYVAIAPDGKTVATWGGTRRRPARWNRTTRGITSNSLMRPRQSRCRGARRRRKPEHGDVSATETSPRSRGEHHEVVDPKTGASKASSSWPIGGRSALAFSPDGATLFATSTEHPCSAGDGRTECGSRHRAADVGPPQLLVRAIGAGSAAWPGPRGRTSWGVGAPSGNCSAADGTSQGRSVDRHAGQQFVPDRLLRPIAQKELPTGS